MPDKPEELIKPFTDLLLNLPEIKDVPLSFVSKMSGPLDYPAYLSQFNTFPVSFDFLSIFMEQLSEEESKELLKNLPSLYELIEVLFQDWKKNLNAEKNANQDEEDKDQDDLLLLDGSVENQSIDGSFEISNSDLFKKIKPKFEVALSQQYAEFYFGKRKDLSQAETSGDSAIFRIGSTQSEITKLKKLENRVKEEDAGFLSEIYQFLSKNENNASSLRVFLGEKFSSLEEDLLTSLSNRFAKNYRDVQVKDKNQRLDAFRDRCPKGALCHFSPDCINRILWDLYSTNSLSLDNLKKALKDAGRIFGDRNTQNYNNYLSNIITLFKNKVGQSDVIFNEWKNGSKTKNDSDHVEKTCEAFGNQFLKSHHKSAMLFFQECNGASNPEEGIYFSKRLQGSLGEDNAKRLVVSMAEMINLIYSDQGREVLSLDAGGDAFQSVAGNFLMSVFQNEIYTEKQIQTIQLLAKTYYPYFHYLSENMPQNNVSDLDMNFQMSCQEQWECLFKGFSRLCCHIVSVDVEEIKRQSAIKLRALKDSAVLCQQDLAEKLVREFMAVSGEQIPEVVRYDIRVHNPNSDSDSQIMTTDDSDVASVPNTPVQKGKPGDQPFLIDVDEDPGAQAQHTAKTNRGSIDWVDVYEQNVAPRMDEKVRRWRGNYSGRGIEVSEPKYPQLVQFQKEYDAVRGIAESTSIKNYTQKFLNAKAQGKFSSVGWFTRKVYAILKFFGFVDKNLQIETVSSLFKKTVVDQLNHVSTADFLNAVEKSEKGNAQKAEPLMENPALGNQTPDSQIYSSASILVEENKGKGNSNMQGNLSHAFWKDNKKECEQSKKGLNHFSLFSHARMNLPDFTAQVRQTARVFVKG